MKSPGLGARGPGPGKKEATHFKHLQVWRLAMQLAKQVYQVTAAFPREQRYGLSSQMQRAAVSVPSNLAEGNARDTTRDYVRFLSIAAGSIAELQTQIMLARELGLGNDADLSETFDISDRVSRMLARLQQSLRRKISASSPGPGPRAPSPASQ